MIELDIRIVGETQAEQRLVILGDAARQLGSARVVVGNATRYLRYVVEGTKPHVIEPKAKKALFWKGARSPVKRVKHPGSKANPFLQEAVQAALPGIRQRVAAGLESGSGAQALLAGGLILQAEAQRHTPVKTGNARRAWHTQA